MRARSTWSRGSRSCATRPPRTRCSVRTIAGELISSEIEIRSGRGEDLAAATAAQREHRRRLFALAADHGVALGATGTHPWADYREQQIIDTEHYHRVEDGLKYVAWRNNTFSLHVHVGIRGADRAVLVCDRLRPVLPLLLAISASSPFLDGRDSGLHSARTQTFTRSFPRCGIPDPFGSWDAFADYIEFLVQTRSIVEYTQVWWSIRPHFAFGTVEVRICDAQPTAGESEALAALIVACVAQAARDIDDGVPVRRSARTADRGEHVARDPLRARRRADRPAAPASATRPLRPPSGCSRGPRRPAPSSGSRSRSRSSTAPSASGARLHAGALAAARSIAAVVAETRETYAGATVK